MTAEPKGKYTIDLTKTCPKCGAKAIRAGELAFTRRGGRKWFGPYLEFDCGLMIVAPGAGTKAETPPEVWNVCANSSGNGKPMVDIPEEDYEIREGKPIPPEPPQYLQFQWNGYIFMSTAST